MTTQYPGPVIKHPPEVEYAFNSAGPLRDAARLPISDNNDNFAFTDKSIRHAFIR